ncbi:BirA family biotin operon repressor/biotin-[acetyl-CoA-carboxylase] ligase [Rhodobacter viridis]|uniref:biotin--[biotin carboxyl-carrier protein] ligase n=1 Tax=Rhodobacter viridis TaxID=1054202 RepID=A0A318TZ51_9RHOB|nr:biotin--[acetyl-CoA-carboxylase] ligase [Rhodobacter viridis]PYF09150.1 BirA family biotin operon repressor/biotin-[acetyl-CoA-carboxylase] ligase [Rhodobacter viridis]
MTAHHPDLLPNLPTLALPFRRRGGIGCAVHHRPVLSSTNTFLAGLARRGAPTGTVVLADHQTAGRGKYDRRWVSRPGESLLASVLLRPSRPLADLAQVTLVIAVAAAEAIARTTGLAPQIKWPNDLMVEGRKLSGILCEMVMTPEGDLDHIIAGIGINLAQARTDFPPELQAIATSISAETGRKVDRFELFTALIDRLDYRLSEWERLGFEPARHAWSVRSCTLGRPVILAAPHAPRQGIAEALGPDGALCLRDADGTLHSVIFGEIPLVATQATL